MHKVTLLGMSFMALFLPNHACHAQKFSLGVKAGVPVTWAYFQDRDLRRQFGSRPKLGYLMGGLIKFPLKNNYSFLSEFAYVQKGRRLSFHDGWENNATYHFIDLSMALRKSYNFNLIKNVRSNWYFNFGPHIEYWVNGRGRLITDGPGAKYTVLFNKIPDANFNHNYLSDVNRWLFGIDLGIGLDFPFTARRRLQTELRFGWGQTYLGKKNSISALQILGFDDSLRENLKTMTLSVAYTFDLDLRDSKKGKSTKDKVIKRK
jgi:hypothetical protein